MSSPSPCDPVQCDPLLATKFLNDDISAIERDEYEHHLESCRTCRDRLDTLAADKTHWSDAKTFLSNFDDTVDQTLSSGNLRLDFLQPTDDPQMLGRLGSHEICGVIGSGGMGIVLKALDPSLNRYVAIKVLAPHLATSGAARKRFARESQAAAAVVHDHVIAIHGVETDGPIPYLIMPYIKGESLQRRIDREGPLAMEEILRIGMQIARGLAEAHDQGLIHRDIKPANILLPMNVERVVITDFGLARTVDDATLTRSGVIAGTPQYMSPEQARGDAIDTRTDLFSLGSVLYAMASGRPPFRSETPYGIIRRVVEQTPTPLREIAASTPAWFQNLVDRLHAKDPNDRIATADHAAELMESCLAHLQTGSGPLPMELAKRRGPSRLRRWLFALVTLALLTPVILIVHYQFSKPTTAHRDTTEDVVPDDRDLQAVESEIDELLRELTKENEP